MNDDNQTACAHIKVSYWKIKHPDGTCSDKWSCEQCEHPFWPQARGIDVPKDRLTLMQEIAEENDKAVPPRPYNSFESMLVPRTVLPQDALARKRLPLATGVIDYFPRALVAVAQVSLAGNEQHNPGTPLHWDRSKSTDEADALMRHFIERGKVDADGQPHSAKMAWRALALLEKELEAG